MGDAGSRIDALSEMPRDSQIFFPIHTNYQYRAIGDKMSTPRRKYA